MNFGGILVISLGLAATGSLGLGGLVSSPTRVIYNPTASAPLGFYAVDATRTFHRGDLVVSRLPAAAAALADRRLYVPASVPVVKTLAATAGDRVCRTGLKLTVDDHVVAVARFRDSAGRPLPAWSGCRTLGASQVLMLGGHPASFDGRYFGPTSARLIVGHARPLWTW